MKRKREASTSQTLHNRLYEFSDTLHPRSLTKSVSPPPTLRRRSVQTKSTAAQIEAGEKDVEDHLTFFSAKLFRALRPFSIDSPRLDHRSWIDLYTANSGNPRGHHFVIHQHDHPVAGTHYDLRLQCNETSSVSWAIMYGLPGDPNSRRLNRNATETRIHCLWNHLIETASHQTGTLLIWDTGVYEVLPYRDANQKSDDMTSSEDNSEKENQMRPFGLGGTSPSEATKLHDAFQNRRIRLRLHGTRLPEKYTLSLWLRRENYRSEQPPAPKTRRKKGVPSTTRKPSAKGIYETESEGEKSSDSRSDRDGSVPSTMTRTGPRQKVSSLHRHASPPAAQSQSNLSADQRSLPITSSTASHAEEADKRYNHTETSYRTPTRASVPHPDEDLDVDQDEIIRQTNAYPGATNSINSVHQRKWYLCMDRPSSGFIRSNAHGRKWIARSNFSREDNINGHGTDADSDAVSQIENGSGRTQLRSAERQPQGFQAFYVLGRDHERSVVTGRLAADILEDEGVQGYVPRGKWRAVIE